MQLADDVGRALVYFDAHIDKAQSWAGGVLIQWLLSEHSSFASNVDSGLMRAKALMAASGQALDDAARRFEENEHNVQVRVQDLFGDLDPSAGSPPSDGSTERWSFAIDAPSKALAPPESPVADPAFADVWNIINWTDYISLSYWGRQVLNALFQLLAPSITEGQDVFEFLAQKFGGDWNKVGLAGSAFGHLGEFFEGLAATTRNLSVDMFAAWTHGESADRAVEHFAKLTAAFASQPEVYGDLASKYSDAAWAAFGACQSLLSAVDATVDALIVFLMGFASIGEALAALCSGGATVAPAVMSAVIAVVEAFSSAWGTMMTTLSITVAAGATLGSVTTTIEFVPLPEV